MDRRIDLTLNGDFSQWSQSVIVPNDFDELVGNIYESRNMTETDYEKLVQYENIFGRKRHFTEAIDAFMKSDEEYRNDYKKHCWRCGKEHRIPWKITGDLCEECEEQISRKKTFEDYIFGYQNLVSFGNSDGNSDDRGRDLFALR